MKNVLKRISADDKYGLRCDLAAREIRVSAIEFSFFGNKCQTENDGGQETNL